MDFTGGLNLRRNQFQLADNESPDLLNVDIDPRGGFYTRKGWQRWNAEDIVDPTTGAWRPRNAYVHTWSNGAQEVYIANARFLYSSGPGGNFTQLLGLTGEAAPHFYDFASWGDDVYIVGGMFRPSYRRTRNNTPVALAADTFSEVDAPTSNTLPQAEFVCGHGGYLFCAVTTELGISHYSRVRWSHPGKPDSWRNDDYLDIDSGGGKITGLISFHDHLLIFKTNSMWALYGYDETSWQLIKVSISVGCPAITAATRSETAVFFFSASDKGGIYGYTGERPSYLSENLRPAFEEIAAYENVFVAWAGRRLWVGVPWVKGVGPTADLSTSFVFDPDIGNGAWTMYRSNYGALGPVIDGSDINANYPLSAFWSDYSSVLLSIDYIDDAYDLILEPGTLGFTPGATIDGIGWLMTGDSKEIALGGEDVLGQAFDSYYRTRWLHAGWPDRKKSWRRPTFVCRQVTRNTDLLVETFRDYNETMIHRSRTLRVYAEGTAYWTDGGYVEDYASGGFDWKVLGAESPDGRGANWGSERRGSSMHRAGSMGLARSVQMRVQRVAAHPETQMGCRRCRRQVRSTEVPLMVKLDLQYNIVNDTPASAAPVDANMTRIEQHVNQELLDRDGTVALRSQLRLVGNPVADLDAAPKQYVDQVLPVGIIMMYGGVSAPPGGRWAVCNGAELESTVHPTLYAILGNKFSPAGTPAGRFHLPNMANRFPMGGSAGTTGGYTDSYLPAHTHTIDHAHAAGNTGTISADHSHSVVGNTGGMSANTQHNHVPPGGWEGFALWDVHGGGYWDISHGGISGGVEGYTNTVDINHSHYLAIQSGGVSSNHTHYFATPAYAGGSGSSGGSVPTNSNFPPYIGMTYIIRIS